MRSLKYLIEYALFRLVAFCFSLLPWSSLSTISGIMGPLVSRVLPARRKIVLNNIRAVLPGVTNESCQKIAESFWRNIALTMLESLKATGFDAQRLKLCFVLENEEIIRNALALKKGVLLHTGHFGNWELAGYGLTLGGYPLCVLGRKQRNPYIDRWLTNVRTRLGARILDHHQAVRETQQWLKSNGCLAILMDHNLYQGGIFVDFFGKPASSTTLTALLHLRLGSPIVGVYSYRRGDKHHIRFETINVAPVGAEGLDRNEQAKKVTEILTHKIEDWVREDPANWLLGHDRWKRQPETY